MNILKEIKLGDCVDFGLDGYGYIIGENKEGTAYYITIEEEDRTNPLAHGWYILKNLATRIIEVY
ncbi:hypothetical protein [Desulfotomaculum nigrificans]|uniref:hypothetical protein n=1 Tax=Desulfotomaculum nigrificans TaxID=1565 RepID=UPI0001FAE564|nr:hypothetical protein [Desulfotomaculum nigrificans]MDA8235920.1 hypothetical protein [Clostridia bacterium]